jgi:hypothetical protein
MIFPAISVAIMGVVLLAVLVAVDWYVWGATFASDLRLPKRTAQAKGTTIPAPEREREDAGFKHVA